MHQGRHFLQIPGPSPVPERVLRAMDMPVIDHRSAEFGELGRAVLEGSRKIFQTAGPVVIFSSSGTGAWEAAIVNTLSPGDKVLMVETGHFATLWRQMAGRFGIEVDFVPGDWRRGAEPAVIEARLADDTARAIKAVMVVHNETSTGAISRIAEIRAAIDRTAHPALLMVDTISSLGSVDYRHDEWRVDVSVSCSQKGFMLPPGLGFNAISEKARTASKTNKMPRSYFDWEEMLKPNANGFFPYTPATNLLYGLREAIAMLLEEGLDNVLRAPSAACCRNPCRGQSLGPRDPLPGARRILAGAHRGVDAAGPRRRSVSQDRARQLQHVARLGPLQGRRKSLPHRPSRRMQRADAPRRAHRRGDGPVGRGRAAPLRRRRRRDEASGAAPTGQFLAASESDRHIERAAGRRTS
ncbi:aspartate aminotransferase-like enzyme [Bradyrhizobium sp. LM2.7]